MRKRRAILFDDDPGILHLLILFFQHKDYDVFASVEPVACIDYTSGALCNRKQPCADLVVTDLQMPGLSGIERFELQRQRGCPLTVLNKVVISGQFDEESLETIRRMGCAHIKKPFTLGELDEWVLECEPRMDLSRPLASLRREPRLLHDPIRHIVIGVEGKEYLAELVNRSSAGICLRIDRQLELDQCIDVRTSDTKLTNPFVVRWLKADLMGGFLAGACIA